MALQDIIIPDSIDSSINDPLLEFYIPVLSEAKYYDRIAGFFTSSSLVVSCKGILNLIDKNGKIRILASPKLSEEDIECINSAKIDPFRYIDDSLIAVLRKNEDESLVMYRNLLAHLVARNILELRIIIPKKNDKYLSSEEIERSGLFHQKVGIIYDEKKDFITFSGSVNETLSAWNENIEEFKIFKSWEPGDEKFYKPDIDKFDDFWNNRRAGIESISLPEAVKRCLIEIANETEFENIKERIMKKENAVKQKNILDKLFWYQKEAVELWVSSNKKLLFSMATGTGKTMTAMACIYRCMKEKTKRMLTIVATPQSTLSQQWKEEMIKNNIQFDDYIICDSTNGYIAKLSESLSMLNAGFKDTLVLFTTHKTASMPTFLNLLNKVNHRKVDVLFIGDETHGLGSTEYRKALNNMYEFRIGLSATPARWFDDEGSDYLLNYYGNKIYDFGIDKALTEVNPITNETFLTPYYYIPKFAYLSENDNDKYEYYTEKIRKMINFEKEDEDDESLKRLLQKRADILKDVEDKIRVLKDILIEIEKERRIENTIIFVSPNLLKMVLNLLQEMNIIAKKITKNEGTKPLEQYNGLSERQYILECFRKKIIQVIVAIKCMDEGIDIPSADCAILVSSTTNPREYIQRIGRVIRRYQGKRHAYIYDIVARSSDYNIDYLIKKNELRRIRYIAELSINPMETIDKLFNGGNL